MMFTFSVAISKLFIILVLISTSFQQQQANSPLSPAAASNKTSGSSGSGVSSGIVGSSKNTVELLYLLPEGVDENVFSLNEANTFSSGYRHGWMLPSDEDVPVIMYILYTGLHEYRLTPFLQELIVSKNLDEGDDLGEGSWASNGTNMTQSSATTTSSAAEVFRRQQNAPSGGGAGGSVHPVPKATLYVTFTTEENCLTVSTVHNPIEIVEKVASNMYKGRTIVRLAYSSKPYHICMQQFESDENIYDSFREFNYQGSDYFKSIITSRDLLPFWARIVLFGMLLSLSGLFSGLNLGLMSLDLSELEILKKIGKANERSYAEKIYPLRERGNFLLCTILLGNVLVNSTSTLILGDMLSGIYAALGSTLLIVIFGEIIPQAACSKHGLAVGAYTRYIMYLFMVLTCPLSWPLSKLLDFVLGKEIAAPYSREKIRELMKNVDDLDENELQIISGALDFNKRKVREIMTPLTDVFMLEVDSRLDFETIAKISQEGYSRIPVYQGTRENVVGLLHVKDFTLLDPDDNMPVKAILEFYNHPTYPCDAETTIDEIFEKFRQGETHLAFVRETVTDTDKDPYDLYIGIVTLEDILEALVQMEIYDEFDDKKEQEKEKDRLSIKKAADAGSEAASSREHIDKLDKKKLEKTSSSDKKSKEEDRLLTQQASVDSIEMKAKKAKDSLAVPSGVTRAQSGVDQFKTGKSTLYESQASHDLSFFLQKERAPISPQIRFVMFQFLFTTVKPMTSEFLTKNVLELIFKRAVIKEWRRTDAKSSHGNQVEYLYEYGKGCNYFILILTGEATIEVGNEKLEFPAGPFAYFGVNALLCGCETADQVLQQADQQKLLHPPSSPSTNAARVAAAAENPASGPPSSTLTVPLAVKQPQQQQQQQHSYVPDFSLRVDDRCVYMKLDRELWLNGVIKSRLEKQNNRASEAIDLTSNEMTSSESDAHQATPRLHLPINEDGRATPKKSPGHGDESSLKGSSVASARRPTVFASAFEKVQQAAKMQETNQASHSSTTADRPVTTTVEETASQLEAEDQSAQESKPFLKKD